MIEALLEYERAFGNYSEVDAGRVQTACKREQEFLLEKRLFRRRSTGEGIKHNRKGGADWTRFAFATWWHYDILRGLDYMRSAGVRPDERVAEVINLVLSKRSDDGRWLLEVGYRGQMPVEVDASMGQPSRWITLRALHMLGWYTKFY